MRWNSNGNRDNIPVDQIRPQFSLPCSAFNHVCIWHVHHPCVIGMQYKCSHDYTPAWEQRKLGELYRKNEERNDDGLGPESTLSVATMTYSTEGNGAAESSLPNYKRVRPGDIAFEGHTNKEFAFGRFVLNDAGQGIMSPRFSCLRPIVAQDFQFWKRHIHRESSMRRVLINSTKSGTMMNELVVEEFFDQSLPVPSLSEQRAIGALFSRLDSLITLHQREPIR